ncbi:glycosyltransferase family 2 protein [Dyella koreensis]|uniref:Glycosyltransferase family 2 protein n=1 Tax=Dyella koreensis TaxID=311235 RepID=A0ABW8KC35_9GAMM
MSTNSPTLAVVVPLFNEGAQVRFFLDRLMHVLRTMDVQWQIICVDDGSEDNTLTQLIAAHSLESRIKIIELSRNFGKEYALTAGMDHCHTDAVVLMDGDLQHPPEMLPAMVAEWRSGYDVVYMTRRSRQEARSSRRWGRKLFYRLFRWLSDVRLPPEAGDFRLLDRDVVAAIRRMPERTRFMKGIFAWIGFRQAALFYRESGRENDQSKWKFRALLALAMDGLFAFSQRPLQWIGLTGGGLMTVAILYGFVRAFGALFLHAVISHGELMLLVVAFLGGVQLLSLGIVGAYIGRIFNEVKGRPLYLIRQRYGMDQSSTVKLPRRHGV